MAHADLMIPGSALAATDWACTMQLLEASLEPHGGPLGLEGPVIDVLMWVLIWNQKAQQPVLVEGCRCAIQDGPKGLYRELSCIVYRS